MAWKVFKINLYSIFVDICSHVINEGTEESIDTGIGNGGAFHRTINAGYLEIFLVEQSLGQTAIAATLEGQQQALQIDAAKW